MLQPVPDSANGVVLFALLLDYFFLDFLVPRVSFAKSNLHFVHLLKHLRQLVMSIRGSCALLILELGIFFIEPGLFHLVHDALDLRLDFLFLKTNLPQVMHFESLAGEFVRAKRLGDIHLVLQMLDEPLPFLE